MQPREHVWHTLPGKWCAACAMVRLDVAGGIVDTDRFDQLARWVNSNNRREVIGAVLAGVAAAFGGAAVNATDARRKVIAEGPCGNGGVKDNRCKRNSQCCTGLCDKKKGKKPYGRCRCRKLTQSCQEDRNCCATAGQPMSCVAGACQTTDTCVPDDGVCSASAACCEGLTCEAGICRGATLCVPLGGVCSGGGPSCCTTPGADATCTGGICRAPAYCATTLEDAGCEFLSGPGIWNCGSQDLSGLNLSGCDLSGGSFSGATLTNAILTSTNLTGANFFGSNVTGVTWENTTCPTGTNSDANGDTCCGQFILGQTPAGCPVG